MVSVRAPVSTILVVDDDAFMRAYLRDALETSGYEVIVASGADEALALARRARPSLVLLDLLMPERSGLEALPLLREASPGVRVVVVSSLDATSLIREALDLGALDYVTKPFHPSELADAVRRALERAS